MQLRKVDGGYMMKLCEVTGLTYADMVELTAFFFGLSVAGAFAGNVLFWMLKEFLQIHQQEAAPQLDITEDNVTGKRKR